MVHSQENLVRNAAARIHLINSNYGHDNKKIEKYEFE